MEGSRSTRYRITGFRDVERGLNARDAAPTISVAG
jgi:hypothetical protein